MRHLIYIILFALLLAPIDGAAQKHTAKSIKSQQKATQKEIQETNKKIKDNTSKTKRSLNRLNLIEAEIKSQQKTINDLSSELAGIDKNLRLLRDSIKMSEKEIAKLKDNYSKAVSSIHSRSSSFDRMLFIFSSSSFNQAYRRMRYLREFSKWRENQVQEISAMQARLQSQHDKVNSFYEQRSKALAKQNNEKLALVKKRKQQSNVITSLKKEGKALQKVLAEKQRKAKELDNALNRLIAEEERKAALRAKQEEEKRLAEERRKAEKAKQGKTTADKGKETQKTDKTADNKQSTAKPSPEKSAIASAKHATTGYSMSDAERKLSGSFESNKGRLLFPVSGKYKIVRPFGRQQHPELKYVQTENGGIDIETPQGANARAVFDGKVSAVFRQDGFNTIVMVRHGNYLTIYVNLSDIYVSTGETVKANQAIGKIFSDPEDDNRTVLHFEVRKEREKLNPQLWVK